MAFVLGNRVKESCTSPGTGTVSLLGASTGYQTFSSGIGANNTTYYVIADQTGANWEVGLGTLGSGGTTLARTTVYASSNSGSLVNFSSGTQDVFCDYPANRSVEQSDVGTAPNQIPLNQYLGNMAYEDKAGVNITGGTATLSTLNLTNALPVASGGTGVTTAPAIYSVINGYTTTATAAGTTTLTNASTSYQIFTGSTTQTVVLPVTSTLAVGWRYEIVNNSTALVSVQSSGANAICTIAANSSAFLTCIATTTTTAADWEFGFSNFGVITGTGSVVLGTRPTLSVTGAGFTLQDATDNTKQANFDLTGLTTGTTYSYKLPALSGSTFAVLGLAQTFTGTQTFQGITASGTINFNNTASTISFGGSSGTATITVGLSTVSQTTNIQAGATASGSTKTIALGSGGLAGSTTAITIGSTTGTSTTTINGITKQQTYTVATLPSASTSGVGARSFVTDALAPTFGATVVGSGAVAVPVYSDGTNWKVG